MNQSALKNRDREWLDYYKKFDYFSAATVRDGCYPRILEQEQPTGKAIVLVHGLSDSPYFLTAIGNYFFEVLGYNVYLPLLHCHGLKEPNGMEGVDLEKWKANVNFAIDTAATKANQISIGGLSTGGTLSFYTAATNPKINGTTYLFSAALDLAGGHFDLIGELKEKMLLNTFLVDILDVNKPLIGKNPYRYESVDLDGARELSKLIDRTDALVKRFNLQQPFAKRVFAAHSESDTTANITGIEDLQKVSVPELFTFFRIPESVGVSHASLVLKDPILAIDAASTDKPLEQANPWFPQMIEAIATIELDRVAKT
jgi:alpha-beta hydrolase superfamily lysophospholipase